MPLFEQFPKRYFLLAIVITFSLLLGLAWSNRFMQDDAFISFRYADNLAHGAGLVWNPGDHIEGYTNFLWTCLISAGIALHADPVLYSQILGMICFFVSLVVTFKLSKLLFQSDMISLLTVLLLGTNYTFSCYATGGLETQLQTALVLTSMYLLVRQTLFRQSSSSSLLSLSLLLTASVLTRLDSLLFAIIIYAGAIAPLWKESLHANERRKKIIVLLAPFLLCIAGWFMWKLSYYGDILPNTFYIKGLSFSALGKGCKYLYMFFLSYLLFPLIIVGFFAIKSLFRKENIVFIIMLSIIVLWSTYIIKIGGDFMEFRFMVPILPFIFILIVWLIFVYLRRPVIRFLLIALVMFGSIYHVLTFTYSESEQIEPIKQLNGHLVDSRENWIGIGKYLDEIFHNTPDVSIAVTASGAIPYYSRLTTIDMLGMSDRWVAQHGEKLGLRPGHQRIATLKYLTERKVNLVISHPLVLEQSAPVAELPMLPADPDDRVPYAKVIELPFENGHKLIVLYLTPYPAIDEAIKHYHWTTHLLAKH